IGRTHTASVFASDSVDLSSSATLTVSGRYDRTKINNRDGIPPGGGPGSLDGDHVYSRFNPALGITFRPNTSFGAYLGYNEGSRAPSSIELRWAQPPDPWR